jgi:hypothetical protein
VKEALPRLWENFAQMGAALSELGGNEGAVDRQAQEMNARRYAATGGDPAMEEGADLGEMAGLMVPGGAVLRAGKVLPELAPATSMLKSMGRIAKDAVIGSAGMMGASETAQSAGDVLATRATGTALSIAPTAIVGLVTGARAAMGNVFTRMKQSADLNTAQMEELKNMLPGQKSALPVSMQTGNTRAMAFERQVQQTQAQNYYNKIFSEFADAFDPVMHHFDKLRRRMNIKGSAGGSSYDIALRVKDAWSKQARATQAAASRLYGQSVSGAIAKAGRDTAKFPVPFTGAAATAAKWAGEDHGAWWRRIAPGADRPVGAIEKLDTYFTNIVEGGMTPALDVSEIIMMRRNLNAMDKNFYEAIQNAGKAPSQEVMNQHRALGEMIDALDSDVDTFLKANPSNRPAVQALMDMKAANETYTAGKVAQRKLQESATGQLFGFHIPDDPEKALLAIAGREPAQQRILFNVLRANDPGALADLRYTLVKNAFDSATGGVGRAARRGKVDPKAFADAVTNRYGQVIGSELFTPAEYAKLKQGVSSVRVLTGSVEGQVDPNTAVSLESAAMAVASRASAFIARTLFRLKGTNHLEELLMSDAGIRSLDVLADVYKGGSKYKPNQVAAAIAQLGVIAGVTPEEGDVDEWGRQ